jgi:NADH-quinone oxidoreductase subunit G
MYIYLIGALTIKPYNFLGRPWEFINYNSVDFFDSMASNIKMEIRGRKITRVLPRQNDFINDT